MATKLTSLYGGAIRAFLPSNACDISELRQVPDNQEVFAHKSSDQSIIFDILEYVKECPEDKAIDYHFKDLVGEPTTSNNVKILNSVKLDFNITNCDGVYYLEGQHLVAKYKEEAKNLVNLHLALFRFKEHEADILVTFNDPIYINPESSSNYTPEDGSSCKWTVDDFMKTIKTFQVVDFNLFG